MFHGWTDLFSWDDYKDRIQRLLEALETTVDDSELWVIMSPDGRRLAAGTLTMWNVPFAVEE